MTNREFLKNELFKLSCDVAGIPATKRQASKFRNEKGLAFANHTEAAALIESEKAPEAPATVTLAAGEHVEPGEFVRLFEEAIEASKPLTDTLVMINPDPTPPTLEEVADALVVRK